LYGFFTESTELLLPITVQLLKFGYQSGRILLAPLWPVKPSADKNTDVIVFRHRLVRLQNQQAWVSDWRLLLSFQWSVRGTRSCNVL